MLVKVNFHELCGRAATMARLLMLLNWFYFLVGGTSCHVFDVTCGFTFLLGIMPFYFELRFVTQATTISFEQ